MQEKCCAEAAATNAKTRITRTAYIVYKTFHIITTNIQLVTPASSESALIPSASERGTSTQMAAVVLESSVL